MSLSNYTGLVASVADFLNRDDLQNIVPTFITLAEAQMQRELRHWRMDQEATIASMGRYTALPDGFRAAERVNMEGSEVKLVPVTTQRIQDMRNGSNSGTPCYFAITGQQLELYPVPESGNIELLYRENIPALSDSNQTNWLLEEGPDAYLYGALLQSSPYLQDDERLPIWSSLYAGAIRSLNISSDRARYSPGSTVTIGVGL